MNEKIFNDVVGILKTQCGVKADIEPSSIIQQDLELDSLGLMTLITALEQKYQVSFDEMAQYPETVGDLVETLAKR